MIHAAFRLGSGRACYHSVGHHWTGDPLRATPLGGEVGVPTAVGASWLRATGRRRETGARPGPRETPVGLEDPAAGRFGREVADAAGCRTTGRSHSPPAPVAARTRGGRVVFGRRAVACGSGDATAGGSRRALAG